MSENKVLIGKTSDNEIYYAEIKENKIKGFSGFDLIYPDQSADSQTYLYNSSWTHSFEFDGLVLKTGDSMPKNFQPVNLSQDEMESISEAYQVEGCYCSQCGTFHDTTDNYRPTYHIDYEGGEVFCLDCVESENLLIKVESPDDIFKSKKIEGMDSPQGFVEVETLFCDASGMGSESESALTQSQAIEAVKKIQSENDCPLYSAVTDTGQFQLYVTLYKIENENSNERKTK